MALQKAYNVKIFSLSWSFGRVLSERKVQNDVSFSDQLNGGQGEIVIMLDEAINSTLVAYNNIIRVYESDTTNNGILIYSGVVTNIQRVSQGGRTFIEVHAVGLASLLMWPYFYSGSYSFALNQEIATSIKDVVNYFSTIYSWLISYTGSSIENTGIVANNTFDYLKCFEAIRKVVAWATFFYYIGADGVLQYHPKTGGVGQVEHFLTMGDDIEDIRIEENAEDIVNKYILTWASGTVTVQDATSISTYGIRELHETDTSIADVSTANATANAYITNNKDLKRKIKITVLPNYNIETIHPWDLITVRNFDYTISSLKILKTEYNSERITLELEQITSLALEISRI